MQSYSPESQVLGSQLIVGRYSKHWWCCFRFVCFLFLFLFLFVFFGLFISSFLFVSVTCFLVSLASFFVIAASGSEGWVLSFFCVVSFVFIVFFPRGEGYFNLLVGGAKNSSSAGQSMRHASILEAYISFGKVERVCV